MIRRTIFVFVFAHPQWLGLTETAKIKTSIFAKRRDSSKRTKEKESRSRNLLLLMHVHYSKPKHVLAGNLFLVLMRPYSRISFSITFDKNLRAEDILRGIMFNLLDLSFDHCFCFQSETGAMIR